MSLQGQRILVTRNEKQGGKLSFLLQQKGALVFCLPMIEIVPPNSWKDFDFCASRIEQIDWIFFTSANAVTFFLQRWKQQNHYNILFDWSGQVGCIGSATAAAWQQVGGQVALLPKTQFQTKSLLAELQSQEWGGKTCWLPQSEIAHSMLMQGLIELGSIVKPTVVYQTILPQDTTPEKIWQQLQENHLDWLTFTSPSAVLHFFQLCPLETWQQFSSRPRLACIGETTAHALRKQQLIPDVVSRQQTLSGMVEAIHNYLYSSDP